MSYERWQMGDPARVLERRGQDCDYCVNLGRWKMGGETVIACDNPDAPKAKREQAPQRRCHLWIHKGATNGQ